MSAIFRAIQKGDEERALALLEKDSSQAHGRARHGETVLYSASENGMEQVVKALLEANADPNRPTAHKQIPLTAALNQKFERVAELVWRWRWWR